MCKRFTPADGSRENFAAEWFLADVRVSLLSGAEFINFSAVEDDHKLCQWLRECEVRGCGKAGREEPVPRAPCGDWQLDEK